MLMKLSIIIPFFNNSDQLIKLLKELERQVKSNNNFIEIIVVDDGSKTKEKNIIFNYIMENNIRIKFLIGKHGGLGKARNRGIEKSMGKYITFLDSDDFIGPKYVEGLLNDIFKHPADIIIYGFKKIFNKKVLLYKLPAEGNTNRERAIKDFFFQDSIGGYSCNKVFKRSVINNEHYPENTAYEDILFTFKTFLHSLKFYYSSGNYYEYIYRKDSISNTYTYKNLNDYHNAIKSVYSIGKKFLENENELNKYLFLKELEINWKNFRFVGSNHIEIETMNRIRSLPMSTNDKINYGRNLKEKLRILIILYLPFPIKLLLHKHI